MKLLDLDPHFLQILDATTEQYENVCLAKADGITFICPVCLKNNNGKRAGVHSIVCWQVKKRQLILKMAKNWVF